MVSGLDVAMVLALQTAPGTPTPAAPDSAAPRRIVRTLETFTVRGSSILDPLSGQTLQRVPVATLRALPVDRLSSLVALQAGVVARGEDLHVRGGRTGELETSLDGFVLNEPQRGRALAFPLLAVGEAELATGGLDADRGGALAGVLALSSANPGDRLSGVLQWQTDGRSGTHYDRAAARLAAPIGFGWSAVATGDATLDDTHLPARRSNGRRETWLGSFGWRADNRMVGHVKVTHRDPRVTLQILSGRRVYQPYDITWSLDGWTSPCVDFFPDSCARGPEYRGTATSDPGFSRYRAADHSTMTDERWSATTLTWRQTGKRQWMEGTLGWLGTRSVTSLDGRDDESYITKERAPLFGYIDSPVSDPMYVYQGDEPYFRRTRSERASAAARWQMETPRGAIVKAGFGVERERVSLRQVDGVFVGIHTDSIRAYRASAPGGYAYGHLRWPFEGFVASVGVRGEYFTAGSQAEEQSLGVPERRFVTFSPRVAFAYPLSVRDVFSLAYVRPNQSPPRDYLYDNRLAVGNRNPIGNPALEPITVISYQAALKHLLSERWTLQAALFYRDLYGLVGARNRHPLIDPLPQMVYENADDAHTLGGEVSAVRIAGERSRFEIHYTWLEADGSYSREEGVPYGPQLLKRPQSTGDHPLDWDRRHSLGVLASWQWKRGSIGWTTALGSPLPWTPRPRRELEGDVSGENSRRLEWDESSSLAIRWRPLWGFPILTAGLDVLNVFDRRNETSVTVDGYPHPEINTLYDDYGAYRTETGRSGGAFWDDGDGNDIPGWIPVHDPRLFAAPRTARLFVSTEW